jgi:cytochrome c
MAIAKLMIAGLFLAGCALAISSAKSASPGMAPAGDIAFGQTLYEARCGGCHSIETDRVGPRHRGVVGRKAGKVPGFDYSPALGRAKFVWSRKKLDQWLQGPSKLVPGTKMFFTVSHPADRAAIIAYLATQK